MSKNQIAKGHDYFFKRMMSEKQVALDFFSAHLPKEILAVTDLTSLELQSGSYIDDLLKESIADMLFKTEIEGHTSYLYLLVDHQSRPDELMPFRMLKYICNVIDQNLKDSCSKRIPLVLPMVVYHGKKPWNYSTSIHDLVDAPRSLVNEYFLKPFTLLDLNKIDDAEIKRKTWAGVMELTLKHIFAKNIYPYLNEIIPLIQSLTSQSELKNGTILAETVLIYILDRGEIGNPDTFFDLVKTNLSPEIGEKIMTIAEQLEEKGRMQEKVQLAMRLLAQKEDTSRVASLTDLSPEKVEELKRKLH